MPHLIRNSLLHKAQFVLAGLLLVVQGGCTYRFSNSFRQAKTSIRTICFESLYATAKDVLPIQHIWDALQKRVALDGTFILDDCAVADAIVVGHILDGSVRSSGSVTDINDIKVDPNTYDPLTADPAAFRRLESARRIIKGQQITYVLQVDVHDLRTRARLLSKVYSRSETFLPLEDKIEKRQQFPIVEEAIQYRSRSIGRELAGQVISDLRNAL